MDPKGKGKARYQPLPTADAFSQGDIPLPPLSGGTSRFPTRYLKDDHRLDDERSGEDADDEQGVLYHEKQWPAHRRVWRKRWCEWRILMIIGLAVMVFGTIVFAISAAPKPSQPEDNVNEAIPAHPAELTFGTSLGCSAPHYFSDPRNANFTAPDGHTLHVTVPLPSPSSSSSDVTSPPPAVSIRTIGQIATGTISLLWDRSLPPTKGSLDFSIASQDEGFFDFGLENKDALHPGVTLEVYDEANDPSNCVVYNLTLRLPWEVTRLSLDLQSRAQVRILPPALGDAADDGTPLSSPHVLEELNITFSSSLPGNLLLLSEGFRAEKAHIEMVSGEVTGSWPKPKTLGLSLGEGVQVGAGLEFFPFDG